MLSNLVKILSSTKLPLHNEKELQSAINSLLEASNIPFIREANLEDAGIVDFLVNGSIAVEVKIKGSKKAIYRQCKRYCKVKYVQALILLTNVSMGFPDQIEGKSCYLINLGANWL